MADENQQPMRSSKRRLIGLLVCLPLLAAATAYFLLLADQQWLIQKSQSVYGQSTARLIAQKVSPQVVNKDILSLNVIATRLAESEPILSVSVFDDADQLLVQGGKSNNRAKVFTAEVTFQDSVVGFVRVSVNEIEQNLQTPMLIFCLVFLAYTATVVSFSTRINQWLLTEKKPKPDDATELVASTDAQSDNDYVETSLLVVRIKPAHALTRYFNRLLKAATLYGGIIEQTTPEELIVHFEGPDAIFLSVCAGMLLQSIAAKTPGRMAFGGVLTRADDETERSRKSASYLASISQGDLLFSQRDLTLDERVLATPFHHGLVDSDQLLRVTGLKNQQLLNAQTDQLLSDQS